MSFYQAQDGSGTVISERTLETVVHIKPQAAPSPMGSGVGFRKPFWLYATLLQTSHAGDSPGKSPGLRVERLLFYFSVAYGELGKSQLL